jgi:hypothetical protein
MEPKHDSAIRISCHCISCYSGTCHFRACSTTEVITVGVRPGVTMRYLSVRDTAPPKAAVILLAGANGAIKLTPSGELDEHLGLNFLIRSREEFARRGLYVAALDVASDQQSGINGFVRLSPLHAQDIEKVIADVKKRADVPVWLVGTSSGTMSAVSAAALLAGSQSRPRGIVLTSTQTVLVAGLCGKTVYDAPLSRIKGPVLIVSHRDDGCTCSPGGQTAGAKLLAVFLRQPSSLTRYGKGEILRARLPATPSRRMVTWASRPRS